MSDIARHLEVLLISCTSNNINKVTQYIMKTCFLFINEVIFAFKLKCSDSPVGSVIDY